MRKINKSDKIWHFTDAFKKTASIQYGQHDFEEKRQRSIYVPQLNIGTQQYNV